jgi:hypothetical protein
MGLCRWRFRYVNSSSMSSTWRIFSYKELHSATNGFSEENKPGELRAASAKFTGERPPTATR